MNTTAVTVPDYRMDYITSFDIRLEKDVYYGGESIVGCVVLENSDAIKIRGKSNKKQMIQILCFQA
jgi:hypothetical protein